MCGIKNRKAAFKQGISRQNNCKYREISVSSLLLVLYEIHLNKADEAFVYFLLAGIFKILSSFSFKTFWDFFFNATQNIYLFWYLQSYNNMVISGQDF